MASDPHILKERFGLQAQPISWQHPWKHPYTEPISGPRSLLLMGAGKAMEILRTLRWVARHDVVIVPGAGVMETSLPLRPWESPLGIFVMSLSGRLTGTTVALVSIGADVGRHRATGALLNGAARASSYRSFRDERSKAAMLRRGVDVSGDQVYADMVFSLQLDPALRSMDAVPGSVGLGVMEFSGDNDDDSEQRPVILAAYTTAMQQLVARLIDSGRSVTLLVGDQSDYSVADAIMRDIHSSRPELDPGAVTSASVITFDDLTRAIAPLNVVIVTRFHNVIASLMLGKPTISIDYAVKNTDLMMDMALSQYSHPIRALDVERLFDDVEEAEREAPHLRQKILEAVTVKAEAVQRQFSTLTESVFPRY